MPVSARERYEYEMDVRRIRRTLSPKTKSHAKASVLGRWQVVHDRHGRAHRVQVFHVYEQDAARHPSEFTYERERWLGSFPFREEADEFVKGYMTGKSQVAIRSGLGTMRFRMGVRTFDMSEAPSVIMTDGGPRSE